MVPCSDCTLGFEFGQITCSIVGSEVCKVASSGGLVVVLGIANRNDRILLLPEC